MDAGGPSKRRRPSAHAEESEASPASQAAPEEAAGQSGWGGGPEVLEGAPRQESRKRKARREPPEDGDCQADSEDWFPENEFEETLRFIPRSIPFQGAPRRGTLSVALPASIITNAQSPELKASLAGQVARTLVVMGVDEVVVYEDDASAINKLTKRSKALEFLVRNLQYLETPQFLRKLLFKLHPDLKFAGLQNPLDAPHHLRRTEWLPYREGVVVEGTPRRGEGCLVECGLACPVWCRQTLPVGTRVTLRLHPAMRIAGDGSRLSASQRDKIFRGLAVSPQEPSTRAGLYWGYQVRACASFRGVFSGHSLSGDGGDLYDCLVGTSERGVSLAEVANSLQHDSYKHLLLVFGSLQGLEAVLRDSQANISTAAARSAVRHCLLGDIEGPSDLRRACRALARQGGPGGLLEAFMGGESTELPPGCLFDVLVNTCPLQASRTIRTEEALLITLACMRHAGIHTRGEGDDPQQGETREGKKRRQHVPPLLRVMEHFEASPAEQKET